MLYNSCMGFEEDIKPTAPMQKLKMSGASVTEGIAVKKIWYALQENRMWNQNNLSDINRSNYEDICTCMEQLNMSISTLSDRFNDSGLISLKTTASKILYLTAYCHFCVPFPLS
ncbi:hypothetical protein M8J76_001777 [Diaphorina citri]|nr:hypothetical protein M8J76_001777 [Diaphorina citri]